MITLLLLRFSDTTNCCWGHVMHGFLYGILVILSTHTPEIFTFSGQKCSLNNLIQSKSNWNNCRSISLDTLTINASFSTTLTDGVNKNDIKYILIPPPNPDGDLHLGNAYDLVISDALIRAKSLQGVTVVPLFGSDSGGSKLRSQATSLLRSNTADTVSKLPSLEDINKLSNKWRYRQLQTMQKLSISWANQFTNINSVASQKQPIEQGEEDRLSGLITTCDKEMGKVANSVFQQLIKHSQVYKSEMPCFCFMDQDRLYPLHQDMLHDQPTPSQLYTLEISTTNKTPEGGLVLPIDIFEVEMIFAYTAILVPNDLYIPIKSVKLPLLDRDIPVIKGFIQDPLEPFKIKGLVPNHRQKHHYFARRHGISGVSVIDEHRRMVNVPEWLIGVDRFEARKIVAQRLIDMGILRKKRIINRMISIDLNGEEATFLMIPQWFFKNDSGDDWPVTRSCYYGHKVSDYDNAQNKYDGFASKSHSFGGVSTTCVIYDNLISNRVFDVWYVSGLWPLYIYNKIAKLNSTDKLNSADFDRVKIDYLCCGRDIADMWVSKMISLARVIKGGDIFVNVHYHGLIMAKHASIGKIGKMSKSCGDTVKVDEFIDKFGPDATRIYLLSLMDGGGNDIPPIAIEDDEFSLIHNRLRVKAINISNYLFKHYKTHASYECKLSKLFDRAADEIFHLLGVCCEKWDFSTPLFELERSIILFSRYIIPFGVNVAQQSNAFLKLVKLLSVYMPATSSQIISKLSSLLDRNSVIEFGDSPRGDYLGIFKCVEDIRSHLQKRGNHTDSNKDCICTVTLDSPMFDIMQVSQSIACQSYVL